MPRRKTDLETLDTAAAPTEAPTPAEKPKRAPRKKVAEAVPEVVAEPAVAEEKPARRTRAKAEPVAEKPAAKPRAKKAEVGPVEAEDDLPIPIFRTRTEAPKIQPKPQPPRPPRASTKTLSEEVVESGEEIPSDENYGEDIALLWRPRTTRAARATVASPAPVEPVAVVEAPVMRPAVELSAKELAALEKDLKKAAKDADAPLPEWRTATLSPAGSATSMEAGDDERRGRRGRNRRQRGGRREEEPAAEAVATEDVVAVPKAKVEPKIEVPLAPPPKPLISTPKDAPQVVMRDGIPTLVRDGKVYPPIAFFANARDGQRSNVVFQEMEMASEAGVQLFVHPIKLTVDPSRVRDTVKDAAELLKKTVQVARGAQVLFRVSFEAPSNWTEKYPDAIFGSKREPSVCDDAFWDTARECLSTFVLEVMKSSDAKSLMGLHLDRSEWYLPRADGYDNSKAATQKFREWARARYRGDVVALRAAWFDGGVDFGNLRVPPMPDPDEAEREDKFVRANRKERRWVDYHLMLSDHTESLIADLAYAAKEAGEGRLMIGVSYGYTFEWTHPANGHLALGKLLRCPEIDFVAGPPSYKNREPGGAASFPGPVDSFALNGKLYLSEEDFKTSLGVGFDPDEHNPTMRTPQALESVHWRGVGSALAHGSGVCWMDRFGNGWLKTGSVWERARLVREALVRRMASPPSPPDVAVFIDERALAYLVDQKGFALLVQNVRESLMRAGMSAGFYLLSDLQHRENFPESRLYLFLNAWDVRGELRVAIKSRLQKDGKVLFWLYAGGLFDSGRDSLERAREVTGIALKPQPFHSRTGTTILNRRHPLCEAFSSGTSVGGARLEPSYFAIPEDGTVLGEYTQTGLPSFVIREFNHDDPAENWKSVFLGEPIVTPALLRTLGQLAGAHVWNFSEDVIHVRAPFLTVHCTGSGPRTITLPGKWCAYDLIQQSWVQTESTSLRFQAQDGGTYCFVVGAREEVEAILKVDTKTLLEMAELPERGENTIRMDAFDFDVPLMNLNEWMEGSEIEGESVDDLMFKPLIIEDLPELAPEPEKVGRRRRTRRDDRKGKVDFDDEFGMGVVFRKKE